LKSSFAIGDDDMLANVSGIPSEYLLINVLDKGILSGLQRGPDTLVVGSEAAVLRAVPILSA